MSTQPFITSPWLRNQLERQGYNPDDPQVALNLAAQGAYLGRQPDTGFSGNVEALIRGALRGTVNSVAGLIDLPLAAARVGGAPDWLRVPTMAPAPVEQANPVFGGLGEFGSLLIPFVGTRSAIMRALPYLGRAEQAAMIGVRLGPKAASKFSALGAGAYADRARKAILTKAGREAARQGRLGLAAGLDWRSITSRAGTTSLTMAGLGLAQPGEIEDRVGAALEGLASGALYGALGSAPGQTRMASLLREAVGGALGPPPIDVPGVPGWAGGALFGGLMGGLFTGPDFHAPTARPSTRTAPPSGGRANAGEMPRQPTVHATTSGAPHGVGSTPIAEGGPAFNLFPAAEPVSAEEILGVMGKIEDIEPAAMDVLREVLSDPPKPSEGRFDEIPDIEEGAPNPPVAAPQSWNEQARQLWLFGPEEMQESVASRKVRPKPQLVETELPEIVEVNDQSWATADGQIIMTHVADGKNIAKDRNDRRSKTVSVYEALRGIPQSLFDLFQRAHDSRPVQFILRAGDLGMTGSYLPLTGEISLYGAIDRVSRSELRRTILHEMIHGVFNGSSVDGPTIDKALLDFMDETGIPKVSDYDLENMDADAVKHAELRRTFGIPEENALMVMDTSLIGGMTTPASRVTAYEVMNDTGTGPIIVEFQPARAGNLIGPRRALMLSPSASDAMRAWAEDQSMGPISARRTTYPFRLGLSHNLGQSVLDEILTTTIEQMGQYPKEFAATNPQLVVALEKLFGAAAGKPVSLLEEVVYLKDEYKKGDQGFLPFAGAFGPKPRQVEVAMGRSPESGIPFMGSEQGTLFGPRPLRLIKGGNGESASRARWTNENGETVIEFLERPSKEGKPGFMLDRFEKVVQNLPAALFDLYADAQNGTRPKFEVLTTEAKSPNAVFLFDENNKPFIAVGMSKNADRLETSVAVMGALLDGTLLGKDPSIVDGAMQQLLDDLGVINLGKWPKENRIAAREATIRTTFDIPSNLKVERKTPPDLMEGAEEGFELWQVKTAKGTVVRSILEFMPTGPARKEEAGYFAPFLGGRRAVELDPKTADYFAAMLEYREIEEANRASWDAAAPMWAVDEYGPDMFMVQLVKTLAAQHATSPKEFAAANPRASGALERFFQTIGAKGSLDETAVPFVPDRGQGVLPFARTQQEKQGPMFSPIGEEDPSKFFKRIAKSEKTREPVVESAELEHAAATVEAADAPDASLKGLETVEIGGRKLVIWSENEFGRFLIDPDQWNPGAGSVSMIFQTRNSSGKLQKKLGPSIPQTKADMVNLERTRLYGELVQAVRKYFEKSPILKKQPDRLESFVQSTVDNLTREGGSTNWARLMEQLEKNASKFVRTGLKPDVFLRELWEQKLHLVYGLDNLPPARARKLGELMGRYLDWQNANGGIDDPARFIQEAMAGIPYTNKLGKQSTYRLTVDKGQTPEQFAQEITQLFVEVRETPEEVAFVGGDDARDSDFVGGQTEALELETASQIDAASRGAAGQQTLVDAVFAKLDAKAKVRAAFGKSGLEGTLDAVKLAEEFGVENVVEVKAAIEMWAKERGHLTGADELVAAETPTPVVEVATGEATAKPKRAKLTDEERAARQQAAEARKAEHRKQSVEVLETRRQERAAERAARAAAWRAEDAARRDKMAEARRQEKEAHRQAAKEAATTETEVTRTSRQAAKEIRRLTLLVSAARARVDETLARVKKLRELAASGDLDPKRGRMTMASMAKRMGGMKRLLEDQTKELVVAERTLEAEQARLALDANLHRERLAQLQVDLRATSLMIEEGLQAAKEAPQIVQARRLVRALGKMGQEGMTWEDFQILPARVQIKHVLRRLVDPNLQGFSAAPHRHVALARLVRKAAEIRYKGPSGADEWFPVSRAVAGEGARPSHAVEKIRAATRLLYPNPQEGFSLNVEHTQAGGRKLYVVDEVARTRYEVANEQQAALTIDLLRARRRQAPMLSPIESDAVLRMDAAPREPRGIEIDGESAVPPSRAQRGTGRVEFSGWKGWLQHFVQPADSVILSLGRLHRQVTGRDWEFVPVWRATYRRYREAQRQISVWNEKFYNLAEKHRLDWTWDSRNRLARAAKFIDRELYATQFVAGEQAAAAEGKSFRNVDDDQRMNYLLSAGRDEAIAQRPRTFAEAARIYGLTQNELNFLLEMDTKFMPELMDAMGVDSRRQIIGYLTRRRVGEGSLSTGFQQYDPLQREYQRAWFFEHRSDLSGEEARAAAAVRKRVQDQLRVDDPDDYFALVMGYANAGFRSKHMGEGIGDMQDLVRADSDVLGPGVVQFLRDTITKLSGELTDSQFKAKSKQAEGRIKWALRIQQQVDKLEASAWVPRPVIEGLTRFYQRLGVRATQGQMESLLDGWSRLHRSSLFGFHVMRAARDMATTGVFQLMPRYGVREFGKTAQRVLFDPAYREKLYRSAVDQGLITDDAGVLSNDVYDTPIPGKLGKSWKRSEAAATWMYRQQDVLMRLMAIDLAQRGVERGWAKYQKATDKRLGLFDLLEESGLDTVNPGLRPTLMAEVAEAVKTENLAGLKALAAQSMQMAAVFEYLRPNSPTYHNYALGRFFGQYGSWSLNAIDQMRWLGMGPYEWYKSVDPMRAHRRVAQLAARYAFGAASTYSLGAAFNVDTSDWIPWVHNLWYEGGPGLTITRKMLELAGGDPVANRIFEKDPLGYGQQMLRRLLPIPFLGDIFRRVASQSGDFWNQRERDKAGIPKYQDNTWNRLIVAAGFFPYEQPLTDYRQTWVRKAGTWPTQRAADLAHDLTGGLVARGTRPEDNKIYPLVGKR